MAGQMANLGLVGEHSAYICYSLVPRPSRVEEWHVPSVEL